MTLLPSKPSSLETRLVLRLCGVFAGFFILAGLFVFLYYRAGTQLTPVEGINQQVIAIQSALGMTPDRTLVLNRHLPSDIDFVIRDRAGRIRLSRGTIARSLSEVAPLRAGDTLILHQKEEGGTDTFSVSTPLWMSGESLVLRVARRITPDQSGLDTLLYEWVDEFFPALLPLFALLLVALILTLRTALRPLSAVMAYARAIGPGQVGLRLPLHGLPRELFSLVQAVNEAFDRMERSLQSQQEFLADAAHELRTPLAILSAHLHTLPDREAAKALQADVARMARLVDQLLMVARLEALKVSANDVTDLSDLVVELVQLMAPIAARRHRSLAVIGSQEPIFVRGNRDTLYQALRNLIENALRFTPEHSEVEILLESRGAVTVADRGPGIPVAKRDRLFQRFFQSDRRPGSGAGLGLTIARRIALAHQGDLEISDNPGGGTRFTLTLPLKETVHIGI